MTTTTTTTKTRIVGVSGEIMNDSDEIMRRCNDDPSSPPSRRS
jgi:hypothetical protein